MSAERRGVAKVSYMTRPRTLKKTEEGCITLYLGNKAEVKILEMFLDKMPETMFKLAVEKEKGIGHRTLLEAWERLENRNIIRPARRVGRATLYALNMESKVVQKIKELHDAIELELFDEYIKKVSGKPTPDDEAMIKLYVVGAKDVESALSADELKVHEKDLEKLTRKNQAKKTEDGRYYLTDVGMVVAKGTKDIYFGT